MTLTAQADLPMSIKDDEILNLVPAGILHDFHDTVRFEYYGYTVLVTDCTADVSQQLHS
jgi:hypothetical protein